MAASSSTTTSKTKPATVLHHYAGLNSDGHWTARDSPEGTARRVGCSVRRSSAGVDWPGELLLATSSQTILPKAPQMNLKETHHVSLTPPSSGSPVDPGPPGNLRVLEVAHRPKTISG